MITRMQMPRQLRNKGGITSVVPRTNYFLGGIKRRIRKLIPNELADVAVKAAPFVAMIPGYGPTTAALMRGIGRFDQRGSLSDAFKQGLGTFAGGELFGAGMTKLGLRDPNASGIGEFFNEGTRSKAGSFFDRRSPKKVFGADDALGGEMQTVDKKGFVETLKTGAKNVLQDLPKGLKGQLIAGGLSAGASLLASYFQGEFREQEPGETMDEYLAARKESVGKKMRVYMDNYFKTDPEYSALDDAGRDAFVARYNLQSGGRIGYQTGGITMANTLAENIARNKANQSFIKQFFQPAGVQMTYTGTPSADKIAKEGFKAGRPTGGFKLRAADLFQKGPKTFTTPNINVAKTYGKTIPVLSSTGNIRLPSGGIPGKTLGQAIKNIGQTKFGTEVIQTPEQATKGMQLAKKAQDRATRGVSPAAKRLVAGETVKGLGSKVGLGTLAKGVLGRANLPLTVGTTAFEIAKATPAIQKLGTSIGEGLYDLLNPETAAEPKESKPETPKKDPTGYDFDSEFYRNNPSSKDFDRFKVALAKSLGMDDKISVGSEGQISVNFGNWDPSRTYEAYKQDKQTNYDRPFFYRSSTLSPERTEELKKQEKILTSLYGAPGKGRASVAKGGMPEGIMRTNKVGVMERDYRETGGFVPVGIKEKADDVPAMLSKNEFVFTADAVRGAGNGSIEKGAQKMYDTMKKLEKRVV